MTQARFHRPEAHGFTLAELLVSTTILAVVMAAVYSSFNNATRLWRLGEENLVSLQDGRIALNIMRKDLVGIVPGSWHLFEGDQRSMMFYTVVRPMDVELEPYPRIMQVEYQLRRSAQDRSFTLRREERVVEGRLPLMVPGQETDPEDFRIQTGRARQFELGDRIHGMQIRYIWTPVVEHDNEGPPPRVDLIYEEEPPDEWEMPQAIEITLQVLDESEPSGINTFRTFVQFPGSAPSVGEEDFY